MKIYSLSASKIKSYKMCPFKFYLEYHLQLGTGTTFAAEQGSMVHVVLEKMGQDVKDGIPKKESNIFNYWMDEVLYAYQEEGIWKLSPKALEREKQCIGCEYNLDGHCQIANMPIDNFEGCPKDEYEDALWLVQKVLNDESVNSPLNKKILDVEQLFKIQIPDGNSNITINGIIDVITELDNDTIEIVDYKTGKYVQSYNECAKDPQLLIYHLAAKTQWHNYRNFFITIYYLRKKPLTLSFSPKDEVGTENALKHYWHSIINDQSPKRRCDRWDGSVKYDHVCKYMCDIQTCEEQFDLFKANGYEILPAPPYSPKKRHKWLEGLKQSKEEKKEKKE
jgi:hypothetical protein